MQVVIQAIRQALTGRMIEETAFVDEVCQAVQTGDFNPGDDLYKHLKNELTTVGRIVMGGTQMLFPKTLRAQILP